MNNKSSQFYFHLAVIITLLVFICLGCIKGRTPFELTNKEVEEMVNKDPLFEEINNLCNEIPLPDDFKLIGKSGLFRLKGISYKYNSKYDFEYVEKFYKDYFLQKGWNFSETKTLTRGIEFTNEEYRINIFLGSETNYAIDCFKKLEINESK